MNVDLGRMGATFPKSIDLKAGSGRGTRRLKQNVGEQILLSLFTILGGGDALCTCKDLVEVVGIAKAAVAGHFF